ncbi:MAG: hypothetical protein QMD80_00400 [archaeon]|nr:hypothetical protein [archaeon]
MDKKIRDLLDAVEMNLGEDLMEIEFEGVREVRHEKEKGGSLLTKFKKNLSILLLGKWRGVKYPASDRLKVLGLIAGGFMVIAASESLLANFLWNKGYSSELELSLRVMTREMILTFADFVHSAILFLLDAKILALILGILILVLLLRRGDII